MAISVDVEVDGWWLEEHATLLQVMLDAGLDVPHYGYHPRLSIDGSRRLCSVTRTLDGSRLAASLPRIDFLLGQTLTRVPELAHADVTFPATTFAEKNGVFINASGRAQRIWQAIAPPPGGLSDGQIFSHLLNLLEPVRMEARAVEMHP